MASEQYDVLTNLLKVVLTKPLGAVYYHDFRYCSDHNMVCEAPLPENSDTLVPRKVRPDCKTCFEKDTLNLLTTTAVRNKEDLASVRSFWETAYKRLVEETRVAGLLPAKNAVAEQTIIAERAAYVSYLGVAVRVVRPAVVRGVQSCTTQSQSHKDYTAFLAQFEKDAFTRRPIKGDTSMMVVCPEHNVVGHLFPLLNSNHYVSSCLCCIVKIDIPNIPSSAAYERDDDALSVRAFVSSRV